MSKNPSPPTAPLPNPWPYRLAVLQAGLTFPLIWVGGLVTTTDAGMAVPDWPGTFGYNLFLYPWTTWLLGPWDLFIEHGHRLLASLVGFISVALLAITLWLEPRNWLRWAAAGAVALVVAQGVLGGMRVLFADRILAMAHGSLGPFFFGYTVALAIWFSPLWRTTHRDVDVREEGGLFRGLSLATVALAFGQLVLGAGLRHIPAWAPPELFSNLVVAHVVVAGLLVAVIGAVAMQAWSHFAKWRAISFPATAMFLLLLLQLGLGGGTWVVKYGWPDWVDQNAAMLGFTIEAEGLLQTHVVTAHVAIGSAILACGVMVAAAAQALLRPASSAASLAELQPDPSARPFAGAAT